MTAPPPPLRDAAPARPGLFAIITRDLRLKAMALLLAVLLWLVVKAGAPSEGYVTLRVEPVLDSSLALLGETPTVRALVAGRTADLVTLYAAPPVVRRAIGGDAPDTLVLDVTPGDVRLPPDLAEVVHVLDVQPRRVTLRFETRATRQVRVVNEGRISVQDGARTVRFEPATVRITGPRALVRRIGTVRPVPLAIAAGDTLPHAAELDTTGLGVQASPARVRVRTVPEERR